MRTFDLMPRRGVRLVLAAAGALVLQLAGAKTASAATVTTCSPATSGTAHVLCWLDLTGYPGTGSVAYQWTVPDGSVLSATLTNPSTTSVGSIIATPVQAAAFFGNTTNGVSYYVGVPKNIAVTESLANNNVPLSLTGLTLKDTAGATLPSFTMAGADVETTDSGDTNIKWNASTGSGTWQVLQLLGTLPSTTANTCALTIATVNATCTAPTNGSEADEYILSDVISSGGSVAMQAATSAASKEDYAFAIQLAQITVNKMLTARVATSDQFTVETIAPGKTAPAFTGATTGTGTTATTGVGIVIPNDTYTITETASNNDLASYATSIACSNAKPGSTTPLPTGMGTSFKVTPALDDQITCTFLNEPKATVTKSVTNVTNPNGTTTADTGIPGDDLEYGLTFTNTTGLPIPATAANPIVIKDTVPANTTYVKSACTAPSGLTCTVTAPAAGSTGTAISYSFVGTLAAGATATGTFDVAIK